MENKTPNLQPETLPELPGLKDVLAWPAKKAKARAESNYQSMADVDWEDLEFYIDKCRRTPNKDDFATAERILVALRIQLLERPKNDKDGKSVGK